MAAMEMVLQFKQTPKKDMKLSKRTVKLMEKYVQL